MDQPSQHPPPLPGDLPPEESVVERTMAVWLSDSPQGAAGGPSAPADAPQAGPPGYGGYGTTAPYQNGHGTNETAALPGQQPGGWQPETWQQPEPWQQQGPGGFGPGGPQPHRRSSGASKPLIFIVAGLVAVALVAVAVALWPDGGGTKSPTSAGQSPSAAAANSPATTAKTNSLAHREAVGVNKILNASATSRGELARAITAAGTCAGLPTAIAGFERVATERRTQLTRTRAAKVGALPTGARLRQTLARSIQYSLAVDQSLLTWAQGKQGCHGKPKPDANYRRARGPLSVQASGSKAQFAALWAPVARQHHLPPRTARSF